jgi:hypothetical protein
LLAVFGVAVYVLADGFDLGIDAACAYRCRHPELPQTGPARTGRPDDKLTLSDQSDHFTEHFKFRRRHHVARQARSDFAANGSLPTKKKATLGLIYAPKLK